MTFYNRIEELNALDTAFESPGHDFVVVYGRRRVGKTELLKEFCAERPHIYFLASQEAEHRQLEKFVDQVADYFEERVPRIDGWDEAFDQLVDLGADELVVVVGYLKEVIIDHYGDTYNWIPITYAHQREQHGLAHALLTVEDHIDDDFMLILGDNIFEANLDDIVQRQQEDRADAAFLVEEVPWTRPHATASVTPISTVRLPTSSRNPTIHHRTS